MTRTARTVALAVSTVLILGALSPTVSARQHRRSDIANHPLVGAWLSRASTEDPAGPPELASFHADGIVRIAGPGGPLVGAWDPTGARSADVTVVFPVDLGAGFVGLGTVRGSVEVAEDGQTFEGTFTLEFGSEAEGQTIEGFPSGQLGPNTVTAERITVEPVGEAVGPVPVPEDFTPEGPPSPDGSPAPGAAEVDVSPAVNEADGSPEGSPGLTDTAASPEASPAA